MSILINMQCLPTAQEEALRAALTESDRAGKAKATELARLTEEVGTRR